jgi:hypothetical protein
MGQPLDAILRADLKGSRNDDGTTNYETINISEATASDDVSGSEQGGLVVVEYANGVGNDIDFTVQGSADNISFADLASNAATENVTDASGMIIFDLANFNGNFVRLSYTVNSGSADIYVYSSFKRRH